jgi:signal transduction histidine kinase
MLTGFLSTMSLTVAVIYSVFDLFNGVIYSQPAYFFLVVASILTILFLRSGRFTLAKIILIIITNLVVFWSAIIDPFETGVFLFFIPTGIGPFAILGSEQVKTSIAFVIFTTLLFLIAYVMEFDPVNLPPPSPGYIKTSLLFNFFISMTISILAVKFLIGLNKNSEEELIQKEIFAKQKNEELQKVNIELDRFVYSVSHDLRSPLSSILGLINIAKHSTDPAEIQQILLMIQDRVNSQDHFIKEIIDYSRNTRTETIREKVNIKNLVNEIISSIRFSLNADRIEFRVLIDDDLLIESDRIRLTVILSNLIGNSIKYHDVSKSQPFIEIGLKDNGSIIYIRDNGSGIKPEHQEKIFNMFYRASENSKGSGLGLFITKETITKLGGYITVNSTYGEGSTFEVFIPSAS